MLAEAEPSVLNELRAATAARHASLDGKLALLDGSISLARYQAFLRGCLRAVAPLEAALTPWVTSATSRGELIRADLAALGDSQPELDKPHAVHIANIAQAFGARYVIEGSALGGAVLARTFQTTLALSPESLRYLTLHGERLGEHWRSFLSELDEWGKTATFETRREACESARSVFDVYEEAFETMGAFSSQS